MKVFYQNLKKKEELELQPENFYKEIAKKLCEETETQEITVTIDKVGEIYYQVTFNPDSHFITELDNTIPDDFLKENAEECYLTCVIPNENAYKFYQITLDGNQIIAEYGRMGTEKGDFFGARTYSYTKRMFWIKYMEKIKKGYVDRTELYLTKDTPVEKKERIRQEIDEISAKLFKQLCGFSKKAMDEAKVSVPITQAIIDESKRLLKKLQNSISLKEFNATLLEMIAILQRPVATGDGTGVKRMLAKDAEDYARIIERESDLIQAMEGLSNTGNTSEDFLDHDIEVYIATAKQKEQVLSKLSDELKGKVKTVYRVIPRKQQKAFDEYLKKNGIKKVKQLWHGSRNQNWLSIIMNSLKLNPDAMITGKMFGMGIYFAPSSMKSWNYTSYRGTRWVKGSSDTAFMGLYAVAYGKPLDTDTWSYSTDYRNKTIDGGYDCLHAHKGSALRNDEIVFYHEDAMVLNYIVEFE